MSASFPCDYSFPVPFGANGAAGVEFYKALIGYVPAWIADLAEEISIILVFLEKNPTVSAMRSALVLSMYTL